MEKVIKKVTIVIESESMSGDRMAKDEIELCPVSSESFETLFRNGTIRFDADALTRNMVDRVDAPSPCRKTPAPMAILQRKVVNGNILDEIEAIRLSPLTEISLNFYVPTNGGVRHSGSGMTRDGKTGWGTLRDRSPIGSVGGTDVSYPKTEEK